MTITAKQRDERILGLGASDMPAVCGCDPYKTIGDLWLEKTGRVPPCESNEAMELGNVLEPFVLRCAEKQLGPIIRTRKTRLIEGTPIRVNLDALTRAAREPVEGKTHGLLWRADETWGEEGTDEVPLRVIIQVTTQIVATKSELAHIAAFVAGRGKVVTLYRVERNEQLCDTIVDRARWAWECIESDTPPDIRCAKCFGAMTPDQKVCACGGLPMDTMPSLPVLKTVRREPGKIVEISPDVVGPWLKARESVSVAEKEKKAADRMLLAALGDAEGATWGTSQMVTFMQEHRKEHVVSEKDSRALRLRKKG